MKTLIKYTTFIDCVRHAFIKFRPLQATASLMTILLVITVVVSSVQIILIRKSLFIGNTVDYSQLCLILFLLLCLCHQSSATVTVDNKYFSWSLLDCLCNHQSKTWLLCD